MIMTLLIGSMFLILILIAVLALHINMRGWIEKMEELNRQRFNQLSEMVEDVKALFIKDVKDILERANGIMKEKNISDY